MEFSLEPRIEKLEETQLIGNKLKMSYLTNKTGELWRNFSPRIKEIENKSGSDLFSVEIYNDANFFTHFDPNRDFTKWAAVSVLSYDSIPNGMEKLIIPSGLYAVFNYRGEPSKAPPAFQYIYGDWLPNSDYELDNRPYFARMGEKYKGEFPDSEEELWVPVRTRI